jgi:3-hydroxyacyl-CoA dehydrogenase
MSNFIVRKVAVLGAGVMGAQIAAHCVNAKVPVVLFDLPAKEGPKNGIVLKAIEGLKNSARRRWATRTTRPASRSPTTTTTSNCSRAAT